MLFCYLLFSLCWFWSFAALLLWCLLRVWFVWMMAGLPVVKLLIGVWFLLFGFCLALIVYFDIA